MTKEFLCPRCNHVVDITEYRYEGFSIFQCRGHVPDIFFIKKNDALCELELEEDPLTYFQSFPLIPAFTSYLRPIDFERVEFALSLQSPPRPPLPVMHHRFT